MLFNHHLPIRVAALHHNHTSAVEATQSGGACDELLFWAVVVLLIGYVVYNVIDLWRK